jgi:aspartate aminotransferase-like enzyme
MSMPSENGELAEFSVVFTDRALNHMSARFQQVMRYLSSTLRSVYRAEAVAVVPGGGTYAMEAVARQLTNPQSRPALVVRNGWFSFRWSQILASIGSAEPIVLCARPSGDGRTAPYAPPPIAEVVAAIHTHRPPVVFAAHVETAAGLMLPDAYLKAVADAVHAVDGLFVLDCIASGAMWVDMRALDVDVLLSAPQKGWSGPACAGLVMLGERGEAAVDHTTSSSFAMDLRRWLDIQRAYDAGGHAYHATMPTDALAEVGAALQATVAFGLDRARAAQSDLGTKVRALLSRHGLSSVAAPGFEAPGVVVVFAPNEAVRSGRAFAEQGIQVAGGVPLRCGEGPEFSTVRLGLFGLDKLGDVDGTVVRLVKALAEMNLSP